MLLHEAGRLRVDRGVPVGATSGQERYFTSVDRGVGGFKAQTELGGQYADLGEWDNAEASCAGNRNADLPPGLAWARRVVRGKLDEASARQERSRSIRIWPSRDTCWPEGSLLPDTARPWRGVPGKRQRPPTRPTPSRFDCWDDSTSKLEKTCRPSGSSDRSRKSPRTTRRRTTISVPFCCAADKHLPRQRRSAGPSSSVPTRPTRRSAWAMRSALSETEPVPPLPGGQPWPPTPVIARPARLYENCGLHQPSQAVRLGVLRDRETRACPLPAGRRSWWVPTPSPRSGILIAYLSCDGDPVHMSHPAAV